MTDPSVAWKPTVELRWVETPWDMCYPEFGPSGLIKTLQQKWVEVAYYVVGGGVDLSPQGAFMQRVELRETGKCEWREVPVVPMEKVGSQCA